LSIAFQKFVETPQEILTVGHTGQAECFPVLRKKFNFFQKGLAM
jgi:hypothetical protein